MLVLLAALCSRPVLAQPADEIHAEPDAPEVEATPIAEQKAIWVAGASGGYLERDDGPDSPYAVLSLTRYKGRTYLRGALTAYRSTIRQIDAALPSTYIVGSIGAGGNWNGWVIDGFASYGRQNYGDVETSAGHRASQVGGGSDYWALGLRAGRIFRPAPRLYVTPTLGLQYAETRSLHHRIDFGNGQAMDFELPERSLTANAAARLDYTLGKEQQHFVGLSLAHYESTNGSTSWHLDGIPPNQNAVADPTPDSWQELGVSGTFRLNRKLWLDTQAQRTFGAVTGDGTTVSVGLRLQF
ncbi:MAG: autotransporter outer membrane beta-barrel domain-containing protein [Novosphingobium sp.]